MKWIALILLCSCASYSPASYIIVKSVTVTQPPDFQYVLSVEFHADSIFTDHIFKPGDTIYFRKIKLR